jgi:hypothetical protein
MTLPRTVTADGILPLERQVLTEGENTLLCAQTDELASGHSVA